MIINDSHIHVGQFYAKYYSPEFISNFISTLKIKNALVSSTTTCEENYEKVIVEIKKLISFKGDQIFPVLWITPKMISSGKLSLLLTSGIEWKCLKIHGFIHNWPPNGKLFKQVIALALNLKIPILIHSGGDKKCDASSYFKVIEKHPQQQFILAHGRPIEQAINVLNQCSNAWVDTAFMPIEDIKRLDSKGYIDKVLFGTDFPITIYNDKDLSDTVWYQNRNSEIINTIGITNFRKISEENFNKLFC